jgi:hypothetical protein
VVVAVHIPSLAVFQGVRVVALVVLRETRHRPAELVSFRKAATVVTTMSGLIAVAVVVVVLMLSGLTLLAIRPVVLVAQGAQTQSQELLSLARAVAVVEVFLLVGLVVLVVAVPVELTAMVSREPQTLVVVAVGAVMVLVETVVPVL